MNAVCDDPLCSFLFQSYVPTICSLSYPFSFILGSMIIYFILHTCISDSFFCLNLISFTFSENQYLKKSRSSFQIENFIFDFTFPFRNNDFGWGGGMLSPTTSYFIWYNACH